ncbi:uncharacterized protein LOC124687952 [Lolium rigidum]|uniref:uncharacterized protein LOC124687952 n=1 Tax=Lolium rigidum TaxID=89674 RepID=UPI001F5C9BAD|nr:uncharacterized protein LOC124687952 [Lolium rigidum]
MSSAGSDDGAAAVCCMCGDHAMPQELFRCKLCRLRLQHRHCSELYPRAATYQQCNWCLREDGAGRGSPEMQTTAAAKKRMMTLSEGNGSDENKRRRSCGGCSRSAFCTEPDKPVKNKKPTKARHERAVPPMREVEMTAKGRKPQAAAGKVRFKVKVRRYKLLAEVISC